jgi:hypothetical protein
MPLHVVALPRTGAGAWSVIFGDGGVLDDGKSYNDHVRTVRSF